MPADWQHIVALSVVFLAFAAVARRLWAQLHAFGRPKRRPPVSRPPSAPPLIQIQRRPPAHLRRPHDDN